MTRVICLVSVGALVLAGCKHAEPPPVNASTIEDEATPSVRGEPTAPLFEGLGDFSHAITTSNGETQRYFDHRTTSQPFRPATPKPPPKTERL
jgi:hypothetical protein